MGHEILRDATLRSRPGSVVGKNRTFAGTWRRHERKEEDYFWPSNPQRPNREFGPVSPELSSTLRFRVPSVVFLLICPTAQAFDAFFHQRRDPIGKCCAPSLQKLFAEDGSNEHWKVSLMTALESLK
mmetsp:Transcript_2212/g.3813  ORF Transcript_2212/g.3813 Transcript_2212/m.3813 type:complete len:127 (+) Transcript_2212:431-811(+)